MENKTQHISLSPWISWHEYELSGCTKILIYEQQTHWYYLLSEDAAHSWHSLLFERAELSELNSLPHILIADEIVRIPHGLSIPSSGNCKDIVTFQKIPQELHDEIKNEGYVFDAHWDITNKCNEKCIHCYNVNAHSGQRNNHRDELSYDEARTLVDELYNIGVFRLVLSGGEVLTKDFFFPLCRYIRSRGIQLIVYTNGLAFTENKLQELIELHPATVCFSVYGNTEDVHDRITQTRGSYEKVISALLYLKEHHVETCHKNTLLKQNYLCWRETLRKGERLSNKSMLNCTIYPSMDAGNLSAHAPTESQLVELALSPDSPIYYKRNIKGACNIDKAPTETPCYSMTNTIYVNPKGEVCICIAFPCVVASLKEGTIKELKRAGMAHVFQPDFSSLSGISRLDNWRALTIAHLKECGHYDYCKFCIDVCPGDAYLLKGDLLAAPQNHCIIAKARFKAHQISESE